jgi:hypothetical protein
VTLCSQAVKATGWEDRISRSKFAQLSAMFVSLRFKEVYIASKNDATPTRHRSPALEGLEETSVSLHERLRSTGTNK